MTAKGSRVKKYLFSPICIPLSSWFHVWKIEPQTVIRLQLALQKRSSFSNAAPMRLFLTSNVMVELRVWFSEYGFQVITI